MHEVDALHFSGQLDLYLSPGIYAAAVGGDFEVDVIRVRALSRALAGSA